MENERLEKADPENKAVTDCHEKNFTEWVKK